MQSEHRAQDSDSDNDEALLAIAQSGQPDAFGVLFDRHAAAVLRHCRRRTLSASDAEDIWAMTFLEAWRLRKRARFVEGSMLPWLLVVATNIARNAERGRRRYAAALSKLPMPGATPDFADEISEDLDARARAAELDRAIRSLPRSFQTVVALCLLEQRSIAEAAAVLDVPEGTVKSRLSRARSRLRELLSTPPVDITSPLKEPSHDAAH